jgi:hypothetical protein
MSSQHPLTPEERARREREAAAAATGAPATATPTPPGSGTTPAAPAKIPVFIENPNQFKAAINKAKIASVKENADGSFSIGGYATMEKNADGKTFTLHIGNLKDLTPSRCAELAKILVHAGCKWVDLSSIKDPYKQMLTDAIKTANRSLPEAQRIEVRGKATPPADETPKPPAP